MQPYSHELTPAMQFTAVMVEIALILFWVGVFVSVAVVIFFKISDIRSARRRDNKIFETVEEFRNESRSSC